MVEMQDTAETQDMAEIPVMAEEDGASGSAPDGLIHGST
jgi:hypothetical protein